MKNFLNIIIGFVGVLAVAGITVASYRAVVNNESKGKHQQTGIAIEGGSEIADIERQQADNLVEENLEENQEVKEYAEESILDGENPWISELQYDKED